MQAGETIALQSQPGVQGEGGFGRQQGQKTLAGLAQRFAVQANQITAWKVLLLDGAAGVFGSAAKPGAGAPSVDVETLQAKLGS